MRRLMWSAVGFFCAAAICAYWASPSGWVLLALPAAACAAVLLLFRKCPCTIAAVVLFGFSAGMVYTWGYDQAVLGKARQLDGQTRLIQMEATDYSFRTGYTTCVDGTVQWKGRKLSARLYLQEETELSPGDCLTVRARLRYTPEGGLEESTYHQGEGILLLAYGEELLKLEKAKHIPGVYFAAVLRRQLTQRIEALFPADVVGFAKGLLLGDDSDLSFSQENDFQSSGIRHVIAVSGLHVSILFSVVYLLTGKKSTLTLLVGLPVLLLFAAVAGFTPSVVRACIMQGLMILAMAAQREYDPANALGTAVLVLLLLNPLTAASVSFQLSVASTAGIYAFSGRIRDRWLQKRKKPGRLLRWLIGSVSVSLGATVTTVPLCALYFGTVGVVSVVTNLLTLWCVNVAFYAIMAAVLISLLWMPLGQLLGWLGAWPLRYVLAISHLLAELPFGTLYTGSPYTVLWIVLSYGLLGIFALSRRKKPLLLAGTIGLLYALTLLATWAEPYSDQYRLTVLDVGQGQCILLQSRSQAYLIDCGGDNGDRTAQLAIQAVRSQGIRRLDGVILTHYDSDHAGGLPALLTCLPVERLYLPDTDAPIRRKLEQQSVPITWVRENQSFSCGTGLLSLLPATSAAQGNESSMCILFQKENYDILITGDRDQAGERLLLEQADIPDIEVLVVGHHGAATSSAIDFLEATRPEIAIISVGQSNTHGHPDSMTLYRLKRIGCVIYRTDLDGNILIRG